MSGKVPGVTYLVVGKDKLIDRARRTAACRPFYVALLEMLMLWGKYVAWLRSCNGTTANWSGLVRSERRGIRVQSGLGLSSLVQTQCYENTRRKAASYVIHLYRREVTCILFKITMFNIHYISQHKGANIECRINRCM